MLVALPLGTLLLTHGNIAQINTRSRSQRGELWALVSLIYKLRKNIKVATNKFNFLKTAWRRGKRKRKKKLKKKERWGVRQTAKSWKSTSRWGKKNKEKRANIGSFRFFFLNSRMIKFNYQWNKTSQYIICQKKD